MALARSTRKPTMTERNPMRDLVHTRMCQKYVNTCLNRVADCMADERDAALDQFGICASESCDDFTGCTIDAGA
jgi:hypothetical protein